MTHALYRTLIVSTMLTAVAAAVLALTETWNWSLALLALAAAQVPALLHLQTRRFVRVSSTVGSRVSRRVGSGAHTPLPAASRDLERMQEILDRLETSVPPSPAPARPSADQDVQATVNEFRRELRMTRLVLSELLQSQDRSALPAAGAAAVSEPPAADAGTPLR